MRDVFRSFADGAFEALPIEEFRISKAPEAFEYMTHAKHIGKVVLVAADDRPVSLGAADELSRPARAVTGAAGALLLVHLLARTRDLVADLDLVVARAALGQLPGDHALQDVGADLFDAEDVVGELDRAALPAVQLDDVEFH